MMLRGEKARARWVFKGRSCLAAGVCRHQAVGVVRPVDDVAEVHRGRGFEPLAEPESLHGLLSAKNHRRDGALRHWSAVGPVGDDEAAVQSPVLKHLPTQVLAKALRRRHACHLLIPVVAHEPADGLVLADELQELGVVELHAAARKRKAPGGGGQE